MHLISTCSSYTLTHRHTRTRALGGSQRARSCHGWSERHRRRTLTHARQRTRNGFTSSYAPPSSRRAERPTQRGGGEKTLCCITYLAHVLHSPASGATRVCRCIASTGRPVGAPLPQSPPHIAVSHKYLQVIPSAQVYAKKSACLRCTLQMYS